MKQRAMRRLNVFKTKQRFPYFLLLPCYKHYVQLTSMFVSMGLLPAAAMFVNRYIRAAYQTMV